jgi:hypothetical protein
VLTRRRFPPCCGRKKASQWLWPTCSILHGLVALIPPASIQSSVSKRTHGREERETTYVRARR